MKKNEYMKPAVRVKIVMFESLMNEFSKNGNGEGDTDPMAKDMDFEDENYSAFDLKSVWDD